MTGYDNLLFSMDGGVARITLNRPAKLNSFNAEMHRELRDALERANAAGTRVLLLTGAGRAFCAGQDLGDPAVAPGADLGGVIDRDYAPLVRALRALPFPVVCAVNGVAAGAGMNLALACDLVVAARSAKFVEPFCQLGLLPDTGGTYFLPRLAGAARARGLALLGDPVTAGEAVAMGLIWRCVDDADFAAAVEALVLRLAAAPTLALARIKQALDASGANTLERQLELERDGMRELGRSRDYAEAAAAFAQKRPPKFHGG